LVAVAYFLLSRAKDLSAPPLMFISNTAVRVIGYGYKPWGLVERTEGNVYQTEIRIMRAERYGNY